jgi:hypothetical protein
MMWFLWFVVVLLSLYCGDRNTRSLIFCVKLCESLFVFFYLFLYWQLHGLSFFALRLLIISFKLFSRKPKGQSGIVNPGTQAALVQDSERKQAQHRTQHRKLKSNTTKKHRKFIKELLNTVLKYRWLWFQITILCHIYDFWR